MRIELVMTLLAGFSGGLVAAVWSGVVSSALLAAERRAHGALWHADSVRRLLAGALIYGLGGALLGCVFWLSWGLIAVTGRPWPYVGALFGLLCWAGAAGPVLAALHLRLRQPRRVAGVLALEWLVGCLSVGLLCAMAWHRTA